MSCSDESLLMTSRILHRHIMCVGCTQSVIVSKTDLYSIMLLGTPVNSALCCPSEACTIVSTSCCLPMMHIYTTTNNVPQQMYSCSISTWQTQHAHSNRYKHRAGPRATGRRLEEDKESREQLVHAANNAENRTVAIRSIVGWHEKHAIRAIRFIVAQHVLPVWQLTEKSFMRVEHRSIGGYSLSTADGRVGNMVNFGSW